jgi:hypothetical protein
VQSFPKEVPERQYGHVRRRGMFEYSHIRRARRDSVRARSAAAALWCDELFAGFYVSKETPHGQAVRAGTVEFDRRQRLGFCPA